MEHTPVAVNTSTVSSRHKSSANRNALGPLLCWAVVFADIGTSVYYVPGYLYSNHDIGTLAGFFVFLTMSVFVLLAFKYAEVTHRFPQGGGVVTVAAQALNRWFGALGGMFILVDYFLTVAISCLFWLREHLPTCPCHEDAAQTNYRISPPSRCGYDWFNKSPVDDVFYPVTSWRCSKPQLSESTDFIACRALGQ